MLAIEPLVRGKGVRREERNLKEAGGKVPGRRTGTAYKAMKGGRVCRSKRSPKGRGGREQTPALLPEPCSVDAAAIWNEGY